MLDSSPAHFAFAFSLRTFAAASDAFLATALRSPGVIFVILAFAPFFPNFEKTFDSSDFVTMIYCNAA